MLFRSKSIRPDAAPAALPSAPGEPVSLWAPWLYDDSAPALHPVLQALDRDGCAPPDEVGRDLMVDDRVVATVELCWSEWQLALALPRQVSDDARQKLTDAGWQIILADPAQPEAAAAAVRQSLLAGTTINVRREGV